MPESDVPQFDDAVSQLRRFLADEAYPSEIVWVFREDLYSPSGRFRVRFPPPPENEALARRVFEAGRARGLVEVSALCRLLSAVAATVWFPANSDEEVQGWSRGLKLSIARPLAEAKLVRSPLSWRLRQLLPAYRLYQDHAAFVASRTRVAAQSGAAADTAPHGPTAPW